MRVLLLPIGSHGDVHPFLELGRAMRARGHEVTFLINDYFDALIREHGFAMEPIGAAHHYLEALHDPDLWHPRRAFSVVARSLQENARRSLSIIERMHEPGETVVVGGSLAFAARLAQETLGVPAATVHLQPGILHSDYETPAYPGFETPRWWPLWFKRIFFNHVFSRSVDPPVAPKLNAFRRELDLPPVRDVLRTWSQSPQLVLGFFPAWFGPPQPDWPRPLVLTGFPLYDGRDATPMPPDLDAFLDDGPAPIAFTPGSANVHGGPFFEAAVDACRRLRCRGLLLTRHAEQLPDRLPEGVIHVPYAPFGQLLPRVAALVHHGGIGTAAQGMAAGVPQLVMPLSHDQFDNAARMRRLGVALSLAAARFRGPAVAAALDRLTKSPDLASRSRDVAARFDQDKAPMERACDAIEAIAQDVPVPAR